MLETIREVEEVAPWFFPVAVFILGACIGSFLNVCIYRIPRGESVVHPPSHCSCGKRISWRDNIPILSWFILRGRARCCGARFSFRYPFVEIVTGLLFLLCWVLATPLVALCWMVFVAMMLCATFIDLDTMTIPDRFSVGGLVVGVVLSAMVPALHGYSGSMPPIDPMKSAIVAVQGAFISSALVYWIMVIAELVLRKPAMGEGDVKLMGAIGAFCGWQGGVFALFGGAIIGTIAFFAVAVFGLIFRREGKDESHPTAAEGDPEGDTPVGAVPFGPALAAGAVLYLFCFQPYVDFYFKDIGLLLFP